jgi:CRISPR-associated protein Cas2
MLVLITYDVSVMSANGRRRLRHIAKTCVDYGLRVQNSVFECELEPADWVMLKNKLLKLYDANEDSLRFYQLGSKGRQKIEHYGTKATPDPLRDALII